MKKITKLNKIAIITTLIVLSSVSFAFTGTAAPWDSGITAFLALFQGKISLGIFFCIAVAAVWKIVEGGELSDFMRKMLIGVVAVSSLIAITALFNILFGTSGAILKIIAEQVA